MADYPYFDLLDTPNPDESVVAVTCEVNCLKLSQMPVEGVTTYADFDAGDRSRVDEFGSYIYTTKTKPGAGLLTFHFAKPKTEEEQNTPFKSTRTFRPHPWDTIVYGILPIRDDSAVRSGPIIRDGVVGTFTGPSWYAQVEYVPGGMRGTWVTRHEYFGPRAFNIPRWQTPVPTPIHVTLPGGDRFDFPEALHGEIDIESLDTATGMSVGDEAMPLSSSLPAQHIPATNFTTWRRHTIEHGQREQSGGWYAFRDEVDPPPVPEPTIQQ